MHLRPGTEDDRAAVLALAIAEERAWLGEPEMTVEEVGEWLDEEGGVPAGVVALDEAGRLVGFALAGRHESVFLADPAQLDPVADVLLPWLAQAGPRVEVVTFAPDAARVAAFERHGLAHLRSSFELVRPEGAGPLPDATFPSGVSLARFALDGDGAGASAAAVHALVYRDAAWGSVPGHGERDLEGWRAIAAQYSSMFLATRDGRPVGWVGGQIRPSGRGYVGMLAVARTEQGKGLGRALLLHAFADLTAAGAHGQSLSVEASNAAALGLYRSVGLQVDREWRTYGSDAP